MDGRMNRWIRSAALPVLAALGGDPDPLCSPAIVTVEGSVRLGPTNVLLIELGDTGPGAFDRLEIQGALEVGGTLVVALLPGFAGNLGDSYEIFTASGITGVFTYAPPPVGAGLTLALSQSSTSIRLTVAADCNGNGLADADEIAQGLAGDCNGNQVPDGCDLAGGAGDSNANGFIDTCEVSRLDVTRTVLSWTALAIAAAYDVMVGDLATLRSSGGDFTAALQNCLADDHAGTTTPHTIDPVMGNGFWFLVRGVTDTQVNLSLDTFVSSQVGSRDAEVAASAMACP